MHLLHGSIAVASIVQAQQSPILLLDGRRSREARRPEFRDTPPPPWVLCYQRWRLPPPWRHRFFYAPTVLCSETAISSSMGTGFRRTVETPGAISKSSPFAKSVEPVIITTRHFGFA